MENGIRRRFRRFVLDYGASAVLFVAVLIAWTAFVRVFNIPQYLLPSPFEILSSFGEETAILWMHTKLTLRESLLGYFIGNILGILIAIVMAESVWIERSLYPYILAIRTVPIIVVVPIFIIWFGFNVWPIVGGTVLLVFFPTLVNTIQGLKSASESSLQLFRSLNATRWQTMRRLKFYFALPHIFASLRITVANAMIGAVVGEWIASDKGLGQVVLLANQFVDTLLLFRAVFVISLIGIVWFILIAYLESKVLYWSEAQL